MDHLSDLGMEFYLLEESCDDSWFVLSTNLYCILFPFYYEGIVMKYSSWRKRYSSWSGKREQHSHHVQFVINCPFENNQIRGYDWKCGKYISPLTLGTYASFLGKEVIPEFWFMIPSGKIVETLFGLQIWSHCFYQGIHTLELIHNYIGMPWKGSALSWRMECLKEPLK